MARRTDVKTYTVFSSDMMGNDLVVMDDNGNKIENIRELTLRGEARQLMTLELTLIGVGLNVKATVTDVTFICPACDENVTHECHPSALSGK